QPQLVLNKSVPAILANQVWSRSSDVFSGYTGKNVIVGIIDSGIDFSHRNFRKADGTTRILSIWDQTLVPSGDEMSPDNINDPVIGVATINYGVEYDNEYNNPAHPEEKYKKIIQKSIDQEHPAIPVRHRDTDGHGTHVAGIAAGNGIQKDGCTAASAYKYIGVAPESDLVVVRMLGLTDTDANLPAAVQNHPDRETDAIMYILNYARKKNKPVVVNLSLGGFSSDMDGTHAWSVRMDTLLDANKTAIAANNGKSAAIVVAAGNAGASGFHAAGLVPKRTASGDKLTVSFTLTPGDTKMRQIRVIWSSAASALAFLVLSPLGQTVTTITTNNNTSNTTINGPGSSVQINIYPGVADIIITPGPSGNFASEGWKLQITDMNPTPAETNVDLFFVAADPNDATHPRFTSQVETASTLNLEASTRNVISVGCFSVDGTRAAGPGHLADFSGRGPTLDNRNGSNPDRLKPEICAPGVGVFSCRSYHTLTMGDKCCCDCCYDFFKVENGTSMSAPHVTGVAALIMQKNPTLNYTDIKSAIRDNNQGIQNGAAAADLKGWGKGKANAKTAVDSVVAMFAAPAVEHLAPQTMPPDAWSALLENFIRNARGRNLSHRLQYFFREVRSLINNNRRVATIWHRYQGPAWVKAAINAAGNPSKPIPEQLNGTHLWDSLTKMRDALKKYGTTELNLAIEQHESMIELLCQGMSLETLMTVVTEKAESFN
ncbi:MAG: S8 family serine peptidase, partial [Bacteroidota bacterium]|nr:S8 family serine peptidase [Bacteroidota bacterium]